MKNKIQIGLLLIVTLVLLGAVGYLSYVLTSDSGKESPTQIRKTKASAQTYHKLIALNTISPTQTAVSPQPSPTKSAPTPTRGSAGSPTATRIPTSPALSPTMPAVTPRLVTPTQTPTAVPTSTPIPTPSGEDVPGNEMGGPDVVPSPTSGLLAYRNPTISVGLSPTRVITGVPGGNKAGQTTLSPTVPSGKGSYTISMSPTPVTSLPESGWMQTSLILFIVATSTIIFSLLF